MLFNPSSTVKRYFLLSALIVIFAFSGCQSLTYSLLVSTHNVTKDIVGKSGYVSGRIYETYSIIYVISCPDTKAPHAQGLGLVNKSVWDYASMDIEDLDMRKKREGTLPIGTRIQFEKAVAYQFPDFMATNYYGRVLDGAFAGKPVCLNGISIGEYEATTISYYSPDPNYLQEVEVTVKDNTTKPKTSNSGQGEHDAP